MIPSLYVFRRDNATLALYVVGEDDDEEEREEAEKRKKEKEEREERNK